MLGRIKSLARPHTMAISVVITTMSCVGAFLGAFLLRFDFGNIPNNHEGAMWVGLPLIVAIQMISLLAFRVHRGLYRYASLHDFVQLFKAITLGSVVFLVLWELFMAHRLVMPRSVYVLDWMLCMAVLMGLRIMVRLWRGKYRIKPRSINDEEVGQTLIVGAGNLGEAILRIVDRRFLGHDKHVVGFVDKDPFKKGSFIHGIPVLGDTHDIPDLVRKHHVAQILFAIAEPPKELFGEIMDSCAELNVAFNTVSVLKNASTNEITAQQIRSLNIEDLLGRKPVEVDTGPVLSAVKGEAVMVTGAGGSIGSELCRQLASFSPKRLILFGMGESPLFEIDRELRQHYPELDIQPVVGDIKHADVIDRAFSLHKPDCVFHAAAYKHVPLMEDHPDEAVLNNIRGTRQLAEAAVRYGCKRFVMISTDKAVRPTNVMGATKRMCERVVQSMKGGNTVFAAVRFGNVLGSNGSVIPVFQKQIDAGGPLTVTDPEMTRFFMTIPEAVTLVLQCGVIAEPKDIFVLDMGSPVKIIDLARNMIRLSGLRENEDISIKVTGLRPGEKMYEELVAYGETLQPTSVPKVNVLKRAEQGLGCAVLFTLIRRMEELALDRKTEEVRTMLWRLIEIDIEQNQPDANSGTETCIFGVAKGWEDIVKGLPPTAPDPKGRILAITINAKEQKFLKEVISRAGYELDFLDSSEGIARQLISNGMYSAILSDYNLSSCTLWKLRDQLLDLGCETPIFALNSCDGKRIKYLREVDVSIPLLQKPFSPAQFEALLSH